MNHDDPLTLLFNPSRRDDIREIQETLCALHIPHSIHELHVDHYAKDDPGHTVQSIAFSWATVKSFGPTIVRLIIGLISKDHRVEIITPNGSIKAASPEDAIKVQPLYESMIRSEQSCSTQKRSPKTKRKKQQK